jgi:hypothetical protein
MIILLHKCGNIQQQQQKTIIIMLYVWTRNYVRFYTDTSVEHQETYVHHYRRINR